MKKLISIVSGLIKFVAIVFVLLFFFVVIVQNVSNNNVAFGGYRMFTIVSQSMVPKYDIGDVLIVKSVDPDDIKVKDDLCYKGEEEDFAGKIVTHQVRRIETNEKGEKEFITQGIANIMQDPVVNQSQVIGVVVYKSLILSLITKLSMNKITFFICIFIPILLLVIFEVRDIVDNKVDKELKKELKRRIDGD